MITSWEARERDAHSAVVTWSRNEERRDWRTSYTVTNVDLPVTVMDQGRVSDTKVIEGDAG